MKSTLELLGYYAGSDLRLYRKITPKSVHVYLIPNSSPLSDFRLYEISKDFACFILSNKLSR